MSLGQVSYAWNGKINSNGYNVVDVDLGSLTNQNSWNIIGIGDTTLSDLNIIGVPFVDTVNFEPLPSLRNVMPTTILEDFPTTDFYGNTRTWPSVL